MPRDSGGVTRSFITASVLTGCAWSSFAVEGYYKKQHFTEFRGIADRIKSIDEKYGLDKVSRAINIHDPYYINYYLERNDHLVPFGVYRVNSPEEIKEFSAFVDKAETPYFIFAFSNMHDDPAYDLMVRMRFPYLLLRDSMLNSGLRLYSSIPTDSALNDAPYFSYLYGFESGEWPSETDCRDTVSFYKGRSSVKIDSNREYGPTYSLKLVEKQIVSGSRVEVSAVFKVESVPASSKFVLSIDRDGKSVIWQGEDIGKWVSQAGSWARVYLVADVPVELNGTEELKLYCWNEKKEVIWMDDVTVHFYGIRP
jgi:hypothetical protein